MCCHSLPSSVISSLRKTNTAVRHSAPLFFWLGKVIAALCLVFLLRHVGVRSTGRPPCSTQQVARGRALSPFTPLSRPGGSKTRRVVIHVVKSLILLVFTEVLMINIPFPFISFPFLLTPLLPFLSFPPHFSHSFPFLLSPLPFLSFPCLLSSLLPFLSFLSAGCCTVVMTTHQGLFTCLPNPAVTTLNRRISFLCCR